MIPKKQTRLHKCFDGTLKCPPEHRGNCFAAVIASIMEIEVEEVIQIQEHYENPDWPILLWNWLENNKYDYYADNRFGLFHKPNPTNIDIKIMSELQDEFYLVSGRSPRDPKINHIVIYQNGNMVHDPHPDNSGILDNFEFSTIKKIN